MNDFSRYSAKARLVKLAEQASSSYLHKEIPLNESVTKIARDESLSPEEICRVCEESNHQVYANLFPKLADKTFTFPMADAEEVIDGINKEAGVKSVPRGYQAIDVVDNSPKMEKKSAYLGDMKITGDSDSFGTAKQRLTIFLEKLSSIHNTFKDRFTEAEMRKEAATTEIIHDIKQMVLRNEATFHNIYHNMVDACPEEFQKIAKLVKMTALLMGQKLELGEFAKKAGVKVDENLFKSGLSFSGHPLKVINGRQALVVQLNTLVRQDAEMDRLRKGISHTGDKVKFLREKLNNIVAEEIQNG